MAENMMMLGSYTFSIDTAAYQTLQRGMAYRWSTMRRGGRRPAQQFVGLGEESIEFNGTIYPHFKGGLKQLDQMRRQAALGAPLSLTTGWGENWGFWVIISVSETGSVFLAGGLPRKVEFRLSLKHYGEDGGAYSRASVG